MDIWIWVHDKVSNIRRQVPQDYYEVNKDRFVKEEEKKPVPIVVEEEVVIVEEIKPKGRKRTK